MKSKAEPKVCGECHSSEVRKASAVFEQQTAKIATSTTGAALGAGGLAFGAGTTTGKSQSLAAARLRPPYNPRKTQVGVLILGGIGLLIAGPLLHSGTGALVVAIATTVLWAAAGKLRAGYEVEKAAYDRRWYCFQCGHVGDADEFVAGRYANRATAAQ